MLFILHDQYLFCEAHGISKICKKRNCICDKVNFGFSLYFRNGLEYFQYALIDLHTRTYSTLFSRSGFFRTNFVCSQDREKDRFKLLWTRRAVRAPNKVDFIRTFFHRIIMVMKLKSLPSINLDNTYLEPNKFLLAICSMCVLSFVKLHISYSARNKFLELYIFLGLLETLRLTYFEFRHNAEQGVSLSNFSFIARTKNVSTTNFEFSW